VIQVRIVLAEALPAFRPGEAVEGRVEWEPADTPERLDLRLCWTTEGAAGTEEPEIVRIEPMDGEGRYSFRLELPEGPWSYEGNLFSIRWHVEVALGSEPLGKVGFIVSPTGQALRPPG
jgi:hypothetical protein